MVTMEHSTWSFFVIRNAMENCIQHLQHMTFGFKQIPQISMARKINGQESTLPKSMMELKKCQVP